MVRNSVANQEKITYSLSTQLLTLPMFTVTKSFVCPVN